MEAQVSLNSYFEQDLGTVRGRVQILMENYPEARNDDKKLCSLYYKIVEHVTTNLDQIKTPPETITRLRRMVQVDNPHLAPTEKVKIIRSNREELFKEVFKSG